MKDQNKEIKNIFLTKLKEALSDLKSPATENISKFVESYSKKLASNYTDLLDKEEKKRTKKAEKLFWKEKKKAEKERIKVLKDQLFEDTPLMGDGQPKATAEKPSVNTKTENNKPSSPKRTSARRITRGKSSSEGNSDETSKSSNS